MYTEQVTQQLAISPATISTVINNSAVNTGSVDMTLSSRAFFLFNLTAIAAGGVVNTQLQESSDNTNFTNLAGNNVAINSLNTNNKQYSFEVRAGQLTKRYVRVQITETIGHNVTVNAIAFGDEAIHEPNSLNNDASVVTQNVVS